MSELGDKLRKIRQQAIDNGMPIGQATPTIEELEAENEFQIGQNHRLANKCKILSKANCELEAERDKLKAERDAAIKEMAEQAKAAGGAMAEVDRLEAENKRLREALEEIAESDELASHIAKQALEKE